MTEALSKFAVHAKTPFRAYSPPASPERISVNAPGCIVRSPLDKRVLSDQRVAPSK